MRNIKHYLDILDQYRDEMALALMSDPGLSKTSQCKEWCEEHGRRYYEFITSQRMPSEISGMAMPVTDEQRMKIFDFDYLLDMKDGDMLAFDEFTNGNIMTLNACLTLIQERTMLSGRKLPSILVVAMGNPQGQCDLLPQTKQRFVWLHVKFDEGAWCKWMKENVGVSPSKKICRAIREQYASMSNASYNYLTARTMTNLFKLAKTVPLTDPVWDSMYNVHSSVVEEIYECIENSTSDKARKMADKVIAVMGEPVSQEDFANHLEILGVLGSIKELDERTGMDRLRQLVIDLESGKHGDFGCDLAERMKQA